MLRVEITGAIGSGKTSLAGALAAAEPAWFAIFENHEQIPFWNDVYSGNSAYAFEKDVGFLHAHGAQIRAALANGLRRVVCDFSFVQDFAYALMAHSGRDLETYRVLHDRVVRTCGEADLIINLACRPATLLSRIARRGRPLEGRITGDFLCTLTSTITHTLETYGRFKPILQLDSEVNDVRSAAVAHSVIQKITELLV